jgi:hypothetical protein
VILFFLLGVRVDLQVGLALDMFEGLKGLNLSGLPYLSTDPVSWGLGHLGSVLDQLERFGVHVESIRRYMKGGDRFAFKTEVAPGEAEQLTGDGVSCQDRKQIFVDSMRDAATVDAEQYDAYLLERKALSKSLLSRVWAVLAQFAMGCAQSDLHCDVMENHASACATCRAQARKELKEAWPDISEACRNHYTRELSAAAAQRSTTQREKSVRGKPAERKSTRKTKTKSPAMAALPKVTTSQTHTTGCGGPASLIVCFFCSFFRQIYQVRKSSDEKKYGALLDSLQTVGQYVGLDDGNHGHIFTHAMGFVLRGAKVGSNTARRQLNRQQVVSLHIL